MGRMVTRRDALGMAGLLPVLALAGCGSGGTLGGRDAAGGLTALQYAPENINADCNDLWFFEQVEEQTGVHVSFRMVKEADWNTQVGLMFADPSNMEDMILRYPVDVEDYGVDQGLILQLDEYLTRDLMPNYVGRLEESGMADLLAASDGHTYAIGYLMAQNVNHNGTWYVDRGLLEELQLDAPTTTDEVTELLRAAKARGVAHPFSASFTHTGPESIWNQFASFEVPENPYFVFVGEDGTVRLSARQEGYRACLEWLHGLYEEGLMDPESLSQDSNLWVNKVNAGEVAFFCYLRLINTAITEDMVGRFESILPPAAPGHEPAVSRILEVPTAGAYLTSTCSDPKAALAWLDAQFETETMMVALNGRMGEQLVVNDEGKYEVIDVPADNGLYDFVPVTMGQFFAPGDWYASIYQMAPHRVERYEDSQAYEQAGVLEPVSYMWLTDVATMGPEASVEATDLHDELEKYLDEMLVGFVREGVDDDGWARFQATLDDIGANRYVALYQEAYDAYRQKVGE